MPILQDLADYISDEASIQVGAAVLLLSSDNGDLPRMRMSKAGLNHHALISTPAGLFMCDLHTSSDHGIFADLEEETLGVDDLVKIDVSEEMVIEGNWPSRKVRIDGNYYAVPRNFAQLLSDMITEQRARQKKRRR